MKKISIALCPVLVFAIAIALPNVHVAEHANMHEGFLEVLKQIPLDKIKDVVADHLKNDQEFHAAVKYLQSKEWNDLLDIIRQKPEWQAFKNFTHTLGMDLDSAVNCINGYLKDLKVNETIPATVKKNLKPFLIDVQQALPIGNILATIHEKVMKNQNLYEKLSSNESHKLIDEVRAVPEVQRLVDTLANMGFDLNILFDAVYLFFGWGVSNGQATVGA